MDAGGSRAHARVTCALALCLCVLTACSPTQARAVDPSASAQPPPLAAVRIAARLAEPGLADLAGLELAVARDRLEDTGLRVQVVQLGDSSTVTGQFPAAGTPTPADGLLTLWVGEPPAPPPAPRPVQGPAPALPVPSGSAPTSVPTPVPTQREPRDDPPPTPRTAPSRPRAIEEPASPGARVLTGPASWYGPGFAGRTTACGGIFDPQELTLASRELPCGTRVRITGSAGVHVEATVTDWGPAEWTGRRFDLSQATFGTIAPLGAGVVDVSVEVHGP